MYLKPCLCIFQLVHKELIHRTVQRKYSIYFSSHPVHLILIKVIYKYKLYYTLFSNLEYYSKKIFTHVCLVKILRGGRGRY